MEEIIINWEGPLNRKEIFNLDSSVDYGIYQVYGIHKVYGENSLLYIGKACEQTFSVRLPQHLDWFYWEDLELKFYVGRIVNNTGFLDNETWTKKINCAEISLIHFCCPSWNSTNINYNSSFDYYLEYIIFNFGTKRSLPEYILESKSVSDIKQSLAYLLLVKLPTPNIIS